MQNKYQKYLDVLPILTGIMYVLSGVGKLRAQGQFNNVLMQSGMTRKESEKLSNTICVTELILGVFLISKKRLWRESLLISSTLLSIFTSFLVVSRVNGNDIACKCFGEFISRLQGRWAVLRNITIWSAGVFALGVIPPNDRRFHIDRLLVVGLSALGFALGVYSFILLGKREPDLELGDIELNGFLYDSDGTRHEMWSVISRANGLVGLLYIADGCVGCASLPILARSNRLQTDARMIVVCQIESEEDVPRVALEIDADYLDVGGVLGRSLKARGAPSFFLIDSNQRSVIAHELGTENVGNYLA